MLFARVRGCCSLVEWDLECFGHAHVCSGHFSTRPEKIKKCRLYRVFSIYPTFIISETVYHEVVTSGLVIGARDAMDVGKFCRSGEIVIFRSGEIEEVPLDTPSELHRGELEAIRLALQISADHLSIDDFDARQAAETNLRNARKKSAATTVKGTLWGSDRTVSKGIALQISTERVSWGNKET